MADKNLPDSLPSGMVSDNTLGEVVDENSLDLVPSGIVSDDKKPCLTQSSAGSASGTHAEEQSISISQPKHLHPFNTRTRARIKITPRVKKMRRVGPRIKGMKSEEELNQHCTRCHEKGHICVACPKPIDYRWRWDPVCRADIEAFILRNGSEEANQRKAEMQDGFLQQVRSDTSGEAEHDDMSYDEPK